MIGNDTNCRLLVFAKAPILGEVKTRLFPYMDAESITSLYKKLLLHSLKIAVNSKVGPVELWCSPSKEHPFFLRYAEEFSIELRQQTDGNLGRRMGHAFREILKRVPMALLIGSDCPSLTPDDLKEAKKILEQGTSAVLTPAEDGGYVLIGLRQFESSLFEGISWGTSSVLKETRQRLLQLGWSWCELSQRWDVDRPEDVERLRREGLIRWD